MHDRVGFDDGDREPRSAGLHLAIDVIVELRRALAIDADRVRHRCNAVPEFPEQRHGNTFPVAGILEIVVRDSTPFAVTLQCGALAIRSYARCSASCASNS